MREGLQSQVGRLREASPNEARALEFAGAAVNGAECVIWAAAARDRSVAGVATGGWPRATIDSGARQLASLAPREPIRCGHAAPHILP